MSGELIHVWTRRVASDHPLLKEGPLGHVAVSADFTAYLIRPDGKLLAKKYYKGVRLGRPCVGTKYAAFPGDGLVFLYELKKGKPSGIIRIGGKALDCAFRGEDELAVLFRRKVAFYKYDPAEGKFVRVGEEKVRNALCLDWGKSLVVGAEDGVFVDGEKVKIGRVEHVRDGPLIAASVPGGVAFLDGTEVVNTVVEGWEVTGVAWLGDVLALGDRGGKRVLVIDTKGEILREFKFNGTVRAMDWVQVLTVAHRRKVLGYLLLPRAREEE